MPGTYPTNERNPPLALAPEDSPRVRTEGERCVLFCNDDDSNRLTWRRTNGTDEAFRGFISGVQDVGKGMFYWTEDNLVAGLAANTFFKYQPTEVVATAWHAGSRQFDNTGTSRHNHAYTMGWNLAPGAAVQVVAGEAAFGDGWEQKYQPDAPGATDFMERHIYFQPNGGGGVKRPFSILMHRETGVVYNYINGDSFEVSYGPGTSLLRVTPASAADGSGSIDIGRAATATIGFRGSTPQAKPSITGSRGSNAALASLLTALAACGLITDGTSA